MKKKRSSRRASKPLWEKKNPRKRSKKLSAADKKKARALARAAGRPYPNMVDNARVARKKR